MSRPLQAHLAYIGLMVRQAPLIHLFSDFDGTLTPIKPRPEDCLLAPEFVRLLAAIAASPGCHVGLVSGRSLADLRPRVGLDEISYAGNHGLEIVGPGFSFAEAASAARREDLQSLLALLRPIVETCPGAWIEDKGLSASIHYRQSKAEDSLALKRRLDVAKQELAWPAFFCFRRGKEVLEIRPDVAWHKGTAANWLSRQFNPEGLNAFRIYLGDDRTDEDAFRACSKGLTIRVGPPAATAAEYHLPSSAEVMAFLSWLLVQRQAKN